MKKRYILKVLPLQLNPGKLVIWLSIFASVAIPTNGQKSYIPGSVTNMPGLFSPNARILTGDFDGDGDRDILFQNGNILSVDIHYLRNNSNSSFTQFDASGLGVFGAGTPFTGITFTFIMDPERSTTGQPFGQRVFDYDADGDQDIFEIRTTGPARILRLAAGVYTVGVLSPSFPTTLSNSVSRWVTADLDSDGDEDVLYQSGNVSGTGIFSIRNDGGGTWVLHAAGAGGTFAAGPLIGLTFTKIGNTADISQFFFDADGDGDKDLYELSIAGAARYFARTGATFGAAALPTGLISTLTPTLFRMLPADYDKDGDIDLFYQASNTAATNIRYLQNNHNGTFTLSNAVSGQFSGVNMPFGMAIFSFVSKAATNREQIMLDVDGDADLDMLQLGTVGTSVLLQTGANLPIKLEYFTVAKKGSQVEVKWKTSEEINVNYFTIEHSIDAINFKQLKETKASGNTVGADYSYSHATPVKGLQYYRLVEYDLDGSKTFFPIKSIQFDELKKPVEIYPNVIASRVTAYFKQARFMRVQLMDQMGRVLKVNDITNQEAEVNIDMSSYASGIYYLKFIGNDETITERIMKR
jgi:hypothetical protein